MRLTSYIKALVGDKGLEEDDFELLLDYLYEYHRIKPDSDHKDISVHMLGQFLSYLNDHVFVEYQRRKIYKAVTDLFVDLGELPRNVRMAMRPPMRRVRKKPLTQEQLDSAWTWLDRKVFINEQKEAAKKKAKRKKK